MTTKHSKSANHQCSLLKKQLLNDLHQLSNRELEELGAWHGSISETVDNIAISQGCNTKKSNS